MSEPIFAKDLFIQYRNRTNLLAQEYNLAKQAFPFAEFKKLERAIEANSALCALWGFVATKVSEKPYWEENQ